MSSYAIIVDIFAILVAIVGFHLVFRQRTIRCLSRKWRGLPPKERAPGAPGADEDPAHYAMIIFGMMALAFGIIMFAFTTSYALMT
jgi:hypothetical protein